MSVRTVSDVDLNALLPEVIRLQNGYARAIDVRDWELFRAQFSDDVLAEYPNDNRWEGMDAWLEFFIPFHDNCLWIQHVMTNHFVDVDADGVWASCYGSVQWTFRDRPDRINRATVVYHDRLRSDDGRWVIARRRLDILSSQSDVPRPAGASFPASVLDVAGQL